MLCFFLAFCLYIVYTYRIPKHPIMQDTNFIICTPEGITPLGQRGGSGGVKYPWMSEQIKVGGGFFVERTKEQIDTDKARPNVPATLKETGRKFSVVKVRRDLPGDRTQFGYYCKRIK